MDLVSFGLGFLVACLIWGTALDFKYHTQSLVRNREKRNTPGYCSTCGGNTKTGPYCGQC